MFHFLILLSIPLIFAWGPPGKQTRNFNTDQGKSFQAKDADYDYDQSEVRRVSQLGMNSGIRPGFGGFATPVGPPRPSTVVITKIHENFAIDPNPNLNFFASSIYRSYNPMTKRFFLHPNRRLVDLQSGKGFGAAARIGKIISVQTFLRNEEMIRNRCPQLTELFYLTRNGGQFLTTDSTEKFRMQTLGWREVAPIGMCVRQPGACGATSPLLEARKSFDDFIYMTNRNEFMKFLATTPQYQAKSEMGVCYVW
ncbi:unnamed protein product, partial [Mesorhabditis belari]|uniref:Uncharacterized protein n=1 Tax=Mesorhabditis belari TaxID=2138241 RepID=A0AAF3F299_9BILA